MQSENVLPARQYISLGRDLLRHPELSTAKGNGDNYLSRRCSDQSIYNYCKSNAGWVFGLGHFVDAMDKLIPVAISLFLSKMHPETNLGQYIPDIISPAPVLQLVSTPFQNTIVGKTMGAASRAFGKYEVVLLLPLIVKVINIYLDTINLSNKGSKVDSNREWMRATTQKAGNLLECAAWVRLAAISTIFAFRAEANVDMVLRGLAALGCCVLASYSLCDMPSASYQELQEIEKEINVLNFGDMDEESVKMFSEKSDYLDALLESKQISAKERDGFKDRMRTLVLTQYTKGFAKHLKGKSKDEATVWLENFAKFWKDENPIKVALTLPQRNNIDFQLEVYKALQGLRLSPDSEEAANEAAIEAFRKNDKLFNKVNFPELDTPNADVVSWLADPFPEYEKAKDTLRKAKPSIAEDEIRRSFLFSNSLHYLPMLDYLQEIEPKFEVKENVKKALFENLKGIENKLMGVKASGSVANKERYKKLCIFADKLQKIEAEEAAKKKKPPSPTAKDAKDKKP